MKLCIFGVRWLWLVYIVKMLIGEVFYFGSMCIRWLLVSVFFSRKFGCRIIFMLVIVVLCSMLLLFVCSRLFIVIFILLLGFCSGYWLLVV